MGTRNDLAEMATMIGRMSGKGGVDGGEIASMIGPLLGDGETAVEIATGLLAEARRKRPREATIDGYATMLGMALEQLRLAANGGDVEARAAIPAVRDAIARAASGSGIPGEALMIVARAFARAQLDPGQALQQATVGALEAHAEAQRREPVSEQQIADHFAELAAMFGGDPFALYAEISASATAFPIEHRSAMAAAFAMSSEAAVREAALGFAFAPEPEMSDAAFAAVTAPASGAPVSSVLVERLVRMRPWFAPRRQAAIDQALRALRPKAEAPQGQARPEIRAVIASLCDASGAESLSVVVKRGKRFAFASVLLKLGAGIADVVVHRDLNQAECGEMLETMRHETDSLEVAIGTAEQRIAAALAVNVARDVPPPFALLDLVETIGLGPLHPLAATPGELVADLLAELPEAKTGEAATRGAHRALRRWRKAFEAVDGWAELGDEVDTLLQPLKTRAQRVQAVLQQILPAHRSAWAERCAWAAAALKDAHEEHPDAWIEFALVARTLAGDTPLAQIPLAVAIAENTVEDFAQR